ncbi:MAG: GNAT family N-acetyltransferase [Pseudomonadota bacterium]
MSKHLASETRECGYLNNGQLSQIIYFGAYSIEDITFEEKVLVQARKTRFELMQKGFLGDAFCAGATICSNCNACIPIRINVSKFKFSARQKREYNAFDDAGGDYFLKESFFESEMYELFKKYLTHRFPNSPMHDYEVDTLRGVILSKSHLLIMVNNDYDFLGYAEIDQYEDECSLDFVVYDPDHADLRLGSIAFIQAIDWAQQNELTHIYLGPTNDTSALRYKRYLSGLECFDGEEWVDYDPKIHRTGPDYRHLIEKLGLPAPA